MSAARIFPAQRAGPGHHRLLLWSIAATALVALMVPWKWPAYVSAGIIVILLLLYLIDCILQGRSEPILLLWVLVFPLGYYFLSWPRESTLISFDRMSMATLALAMVFSAPGSSTPVPDAMKRAGAAWLAFLVAAALSLVHLANPIGGSKLLIDAFALPALLGLCVLRSFDFRSSVRLLHVLVCIFLLYSVSIGIAEFILNTDLLPLPGRIFNAMGESKALVPRVNGPFATNNSFGLVGLIAAVFLFFLRRAMPEHFPLWRRVLHLLGVGAALLMAAMPLFRSIFLTMLLIVLLDTLFVKGARARFLRVSILFLAFSGAILVQSLAPDLFEDRTDPANIYQRIAQQKQTLDIFMTHPLTGIGLGNFLSVAAGFDSSQSFKDVGPADAPHNNLGQILAETGLLGAIPFVITQVLFVTAFWKLRKAGNSDSHQVWKYFVFIFLIYWLNGMALSAGYYQDLNLWYIFATVVLYKFGTTSNTLAATRHHKSVASAHS